MNMDHNTFVADLVGAATVRFTAGLKADPREQPNARAQSRLLLRFITALVGVNVVEVSSLVSLLSSLVDAATSAAEHRKPGWQAHADYLVYCVLAALPWGAADLHDRSPEALTQVLASCEEYLGRRVRGGDPLLRLTSLAASPSTHDADKEEEEEDFIEELWGRVSNLAASGR
jgi:nuclear cap-binding protein subunit 1